MSKVQDTEQDALAGKLGQCKSGVQEGFRRLHAVVEEIAGAVDRHAIRTGGEWIGRSYKLGGNLLLRVDPKSSACLMGLRPFGSGRGIDRDEVQTQTQARTPQRPRQTRKRLTQGL